MKSESLIYQLTFPRDLIIGLHHHTSILFIFNHLSNIYYFYSIFIKKIVSFRINVTIFVVDIIGTLWKT